MTINYTTNLSLAEPVTGTESGTWGDDVNKGLTDYLDISIAGTLALTSASFTANALTLANTTGSSSSNGITTTTAQYYILKLSSLAAAVTITAPSSSKTYLVYNSDSTYSATIKASGQSGVSVVAGERALVFFNGTDYVKASSTVLTNFTGVLTATYGGTGIANNAASTITISGNFGTTFTVSGTTSLTLPTSGTLLTTAGSGSSLIFGTGSLSLAGNLTTSGAFATTITTTGTTTVTLPTTGTLVNTAVTTLSSLTSIGTIATGVWNGTIITGTYGGTGVNNSSNTITIAGNLTHAGAFTQSFTATANTAVTLPAGNTASANNLLSSATAVAIVTGTPSSSTYLRGDGTWATISASQATATVLGTVYAKTGSGTPYLTTFGYAAGQSVTGAGVTAIGYDALGQNTSAIQNTAVGYLALSSITTSGQDYNTAVGYQAGYNSTGTSNTYCGYSAGYTNTRNRNSFFGYQAGYSCNGNDNTFIGYASGYYMQGGTSNVILGRYDGTSYGLNITGSSNNIVLSDGDGYPRATQQGANGWYQYNNSASWSITSDARIKTNIKPLETGLNIINALNPVEFDYIIGGKHDISFIAQEYEKVLPNQVSETLDITDEIKTLTNGEPLKQLNQNLIPYLVKAIQELSAEVQALKTNRL